MFDGMPQTFNGSYNITQIAFKTAFMKTGTADENYASEVFDNFPCQPAGDCQSVKRKNEKIRDILKQDFSRTTSSWWWIFWRGNPGNIILQPDVLIPAFPTQAGILNTVDTNRFFQCWVFLPNWRMNYDGLSRIQWVKDNFRSISLTHAYTYRYSIVIIHHSLPG